MEKKMIPSEILLKAEIKRLDENYMKGLERVLALEKESNQGHSFSKASWKLSDEIKERLSKIYPFIK